MRFLALAAFVAAPLAAACAHAQPAPAAAPPSGRRWWWWSPSTSCARTTSCAGATSSPAGWRGCSGRAPCSPRRSRTTPSRRRRRATPRSSPDGFPTAPASRPTRAGVNTDDNPLLGAAGVGASPFRFRGTTLADWMAGGRPRDAGAVGLAQGSRRDPADRTRHAFRCSGTRRRTAASPPAPGTATRCPRGCRRSTPSSR